MESTEVVSIASPANNSPCHETGHPLDLTTESLAFGHYTDRHSTQREEGGPAGLADEEVGSDGFMGASWQYDMARQSVDPELAHAFGSHDDGDRSGEETTSKVRKPFHKWMKTLQRRAARRQEMVSTEDDLLSPFHHRQSSSESSLGFVKTARPASVSLLGTSLFTRSRRTTLLSSRGHSRTDRSSRASISGLRLSEDSNYLERPVTMDPVIMERSLQRRRILEELISTEEGYIRDVRFLMNVYITMLASLPNLPASLRSSINRNLTDIVELHEEMLGELHRVVPYSEYTQLEVPSRNIAPGKHGHRRWRSLGTVPEDKNSSMAWLQGVPGMTTDPQVAAEVARVFAAKMNRFFVYEKYGSKYELMIKDVSWAHQTMPHWDSHQKGLEALAASLGPANSQDGHAKKSSTIGDLLMKPIQRVCKYPLLFAELLKYTPVVDCPHSHMEIENTLIRLREATAEINRATDGSRVKAVLEKTWMLQDRLVFPNQSFDAASKNRIRSLGLVRLCGALHVCWQSRTCITGQYMVALLYGECFCLATASRTDHIYTIQACVALSDVKVEEADNGRGLQCHTAPYSWKVVFICDHQLYEMILTACTSKEQHEWRSRLGNRSMLDHEDSAPSASLTVLSLDMKSLGTVFGKPGTIARRISIHRATTVGPKSPLCQVILKNTTVVKDATNPSASSKIIRSQSLLTTNGRVPVLAPSRGERARLEALLSDVWTRDVLPFPGITNRSRSEHLVRAGASSVMRKLSVASIASSFTKRSTSAASLQNSGASITGVTLGGRNADNEEESQTNHNWGPRHVNHTTARGDVAAAARRTNNKRSEDAGRSLLSVIPNENERRTPSGRSVSFTAVNPSDAESEWGADVLRTVQCLNAIPLPAPETPPNSKSSAAGKDSEEVKTPRPATAPPAADFGKENMYATMPPLTLVPTPSPPSSEREHNKARTASFKSRKFSDRLAAKVGVLHRDVVVQGIRSIFR